MKKNLKPVNKEKNPGLAKLPTAVRNKMGFMAKGGAVKRMTKGGSVSRGQYDAQVKKIKFKGVF
tara:strand:- start:381 stop:572 length:192 start_codon:yes stop_codon:yes gene_type:complete